MHQRFIPSVVVVSLMSALAAGCSSPQASPDPQRRTAQSTAPSLVGAPADPREKLLAAAISTYLQRDHLRPRKLNDELSRLAFASYLDRLDPGKMFILQSHVDQLSKHTNKIDDQLASGTFTLAHQAAALISRRIERVNRSLDRLLAKPFDFSKAESIETDADKLSYAGSEAALDERWRKTLKMRALSRVIRMEDTLKALADHKNKPGVAPPKMKIPATPEAREQKAREDVKKTYAARFARLATTDPIDNATAFINAVAGIFDPHTSYLPPADEQDFDIRMSGSLEGIGAVLQEHEHYIKIVRVVPGGPSAKQGELKADDLVLAVQQGDDEPVDVFDMRLTKAVKMIRGKKGTEVTLTVEKPDKTIVNISIIRDEVKIESSYARGAILKTQGKAPVGYIYLPSFYGDTGLGNHAAQRRCGQDIARIVAALNKQNIEHIVLDFRDNGGGLLGEARDIAGLFIPSGPVVQIAGPEQSPDVLADRDGKIAYTGKISVLINRFSASASEIVAGALQDYGRAVVVGTTTHGKGTVQQLRNLGAIGRAPTDRLGTLKMTTQQFYRITGGSTQWKGVTPDIELPDPLAFLESRERHLDYSIPWSEIASASFVANQPTWDLKALSDASAARVANSKILQNMKKRAALLESRRNDSLQPLNKDKWRAKQTAWTSQLDSVDTDFDKRKPVFSVKSVTYDKSAMADAAELKRWRERLARDPWVEEAAHVVRGM